MQLNIMNTLGENCKNWLKLLQEKTLRMVQKYFIRVSTSRRLSVCKSNLFGPHHLFDNWLTFDPVYYCTRVNLFSLISNKAREQSFDISVRYLECFPKLKFKEKSSKWNKIMCKLSPLKLVKYFNSNIFAPP